MSDDLKLKQEMVTEALLILRSVEWYRAKIEKKMLELDEARENESLDKESSLEDEISKLVKQLNKELANMDAFTVKYQSLVEKKKNEKKKSLCNSGKKKQIRLRGISKNTQRKKAGESI